MITILGPKDKRLTGLTTVNTTTSSKNWSRQLSPMLIAPVSDEAYSIENLWQFSKVYPEHVDAYNNPTQQWWDWRNAGFSSTWAMRYPMGKNKIPLYSYWNNSKLDYIEARKQIYIPEYKQAVKATPAFKQLEQLYKTEKTIALFDYDGYNHDMLNMTLDEVINNPTKKMGHAFVLKMLLLGV